MDPDIIATTVPSTSRNFYLLVFGLLSVLFLTSPQITAGYEPVHIYENCVQGSNYTAYSQFQINLLRLLNRKLYNGGGISGFYNATDGKYPDEVYGLFLCRGDVSSEICQNCIDVASEQIVEKCPGNKEAIIWYDECLVRYSNRSFFSIMESSPALFMWNPQNQTVMEPDKFAKILADMFGNLTNVAISDPSKHMYATTATQVTLSNFTNLYLYGLVQCTPDLLAADCRTCLSGAVAQLSDSTFPIQEKMGGRVLQPSCNIRFDFYPFSGDPRADHPQAPPPSSVNTTSRGPRIDPQTPFKRTKGGEGRKAAWIAIGTSVSGVLLLFGICACTIWTKKKSEEEKKENSQEVQLLDLGGERIPDYPNGNFQSENKVNSQDFPSLALDIVHAATKHFSDENKLGEGGFGPVYKGTLPGGKEIAVKRLSRTSGQGLVEFMNEITLIARLQHRNLVRLLGCCLEGKETLLIYEYMPNKSLDVFLFDPTVGVQLDWRRRFSIINGIARGILYLHEDSRLRIIHRDLKASNVLLDHEMNPKISDFGMARIVGGNQIEANTNRVVGTYGYMAPEYAMEGLFSIKSDVFSFGVLLLEIISGKKNSGFHLWEHGHSLLTFAWKLLSEGQGLELIDPLLVQSCPSAEVLKCIHIGLLCVQQDPADRPTMSSVVVMLGSETVTLSQPRKPAFSVGRVIRQSPHSSPNTNGCSVNEVTCTNVSPR